MKTEISITLEKLVYGGEAMGRLPDGRAVFVPFALPGERVRVRLVEEKRGYARGELVKVEQASPERIAPRCRHFGACGGCHYQHMPYESQLEAKTEILRDQLGRIGKIEDPPVAPMAASSRPWNYRNHIKFHLTDKGKLGFVRARGEEILPVSECHLPEESLNALWPQLDFKPGLPLERVSLRAGADDDLMLVLESQGPDAPELELEAGISVIHLYGGDALVMAGQDYITMQVLGRAFRVSAGSFFQVNTAMAELMVAHLQENLPLPARRILDVYCGVGLFSAFLAPECEQLIGFESSASACEDFAVNLDEFEDVSLYEGRAEEVLPALVGQKTISPHQQDIVLVDPPRAGLDKRALDGILSLKPNTLAYISCDPSTLARDAARIIKGGYHLVQVAPFDLFPQTYHIESISLFDRKTI